jgi:hypothetical protein
LFSNESPDRVAQTLRDPPLGAHYLRSRWSGETVKCLRKQRVFAGGGKFFSAGILAARR